MADTHEEQLLSELLRSIAREDARLEAAHLERRVMTSLQMDDVVRTQPDRSYIQYLAAAALVCAVLVSLLVTRRAEPVERAMAETPRIILPTTAAMPTNPTPPELAVQPARLTQSAQPASRTEPTQPTVPEADEFLPLMPMTERELAGAFQLVLVQMPRASLGALRSPLDHPNELVEAEVLLGEDGMARAIRVSGSTTQNGRSR